MYNYEPFLSPNIDKEIREKRAAERELKLIEEIYKGVVLSKNQKLIDRLESRIEKCLDALEIK